MSGSIHGVVTSADGTVYEGARVELELSHDDDPTTATQQTDSGGAFNFANLPAGEFKLTVSSNGFVTQSISGVLHAGEAFDARTIVLPVAAATSYGAGVGRVAGGDCAGATQPGGKAAGAGRASELLRQLRSQRGPAHYAAEIPARVEDLHRSRDVV